MHRLTIDTLKSFSASYSAAMHAAISPQSKPVGASRPWNFSRFNLRFGPHPATSSILLFLARLQLHAHCTGLISYQQVNSPNQIDAICITRAREAPEICSRSVDNLLHIVCCLALCRSINFPSPSRILILYNQPLFINEITSLST